MKNLYLSLPDAIIRTSIYLIQSDKIPADSLFAFARFLAYIYEFDHKTILKELSDFVSIDFSPTGEKNKIQKEIIQ